MSEQFDFVYPHSHYRGEVKPENLLFNANLQEFAQRVMMIANLETGGKVTPEACYQEIEWLWDELKKSKQSLSIGDRSPFDPPSPSDSD